jgi:capsular exopolysaccharide synthesis family protein
MSPASVSARHLAQHLKRRADRAGIRSIVLTSPLSGDGKTTMACNLSVALSQLDQSRAVVLVDLDMRRPRVAKSLGLQVTLGVEDVLAGRAALDEAVIETDVPGLSVIGVRRSVEKPEPLLSSSRLGNLIQDLHARFGTVVMDTPPILAVSDASGIIDVADACLLVVRAGRSPTPSVRRAAQQLPSEKALGCCLNFARGSERSSGYEYYGYRAHEGEELEAEAAVSDEAGPDAAKGVRE